MLNNQRLEPLPHAVSCFQVTRGSEDVTTAIDVALQQVAFTATQHDVVIIVDSPRGYGLNTLEQMHARPAKIIVVTWQTCPEYLADMWDYQLDALVCLVQATLTEQVQAAMQAIANGQRYRTCAPSTTLTPAQRSVLQYVARGWADTDIGTKLGLSAYTIRNRVSELLNKLALKNRIQLALYYWSISPDLYRIGPKDCVVEE